MSAVRFSVCLPNTKEGKTQPAGAVAVRWLRELSLQAERLNFDGLWVAELLQAQGGAGVGGKVDIGARAAAQVNYYDVIATLGYVAAITERVRLTTATLVLPHHHPVLLSRQLATLDAFTGGRVTLGIGLGGSVNSFRQLRGDLAGVNRGAMMDEYLEALRLQWENPSASYSGKYVQITDAEAYPKPLQRPLPIYVAGAGEGPLRRLARFGQGWIDSHNRPEQIAEVVKQVQQYRVELGRAADAPEVARQFYISVADTREAARQTMSQALGGAPAQQDVTDEEQRRIVGTPDDVVECLSAYPAVGVTEICAVFYGATIDSLLDQMGLFAEQVIPRLAARKAVGV